MAATKSQGRDFTLFMVGTDGSLRRNRILRFGRGQAGARSRRGRP